MLTTAQTVQGIAFGPFFLDTAGRRLLRDGRRVSISPIELKLLETLLRNRDRVLTGDDLRILVWADDPSTGVLPAQDVNALYIAVRKLRRSLGEHGDWIVNIPKVGYTIAEEVDVSSVGIDGDLPQEIDDAFVGRRAELEKLKQLIGSSRLITLTGPPGIGKSRLAKKFVSEIADKFHDGMFSIDLVPVENEALLAAAVLTGLQLTESADRDEIEIICDHFAEKSALILLDNCEHLIETCAEIIDRILRSSPKIRIVATSREPLLLPGEAVMSLNPLGVPKVGAKVDLKSTNGFESVELFVALARQHRSDLEFVESEVAAIGELCRQLEGIPLAIELAAVQLGGYTVEQITEGLSDRFRLLRRRGGESARHRTLEAAVDWSYGLLSETEKIVFRRLSAFAGGWLPETVRDICSGDGVEPRDVSHVLAELVRRSLVQLSSNGRQRMLETIRQFGHDRLVDAGEEQLIVERFDRYFLDLAERSFDAGGNSEWLSRVEADHANIRSVLERSINDRRDTETGLRMCGSLAKFWFNYGHFHEAKYWTKRALDSNETGSPDARAKALRTAGFFVGQMAGPGEDPETGKVYYEESLALWQKIGDKKEEGFTLGHYAFLLYRLGRLEEARQAAQKSLDISSADDDHPNIARSANTLGLSLLELGEVEEADSVFEKALSAARIAADEYLEASSLLNWAYAAVRSGDADTAEDRLRSSLELFDSIGNRPQAARTILLLGEVAILNEDFDKALSLERSALEEFLDTDDHQGIVMALESIAFAHHQVGNDPTVLLTLHSAASEARRNIKLMFGPAKRKKLDDLEKTAVKLFDERSARTAKQKGRSMSLSQAVQFALDSTKPYASV